MKNLKILQACSIEGKHYDKGSTAKNVDTRTAAELVHIGRAVEINNAPKDAVESRDPEVENRDPEVETKESEAKEPAPEAKDPDEKKAPEGKGKSKK